MINIYICIYIYTIGVLIAKCYICIIKFLYLYCIPISIHVLFYLILLKDSNARYKYVLDISFFVTRKETNKQKNKIKSETLGYAIPTKSVNSNYSTLKRNCSKMHKAVLDFHLVLPIYPHKKFLRDTYVKQITKAS